MAEAEDDKNSLSSLKRNSLSTVTADLAKGVAGTVFGNWRIRKAKEAEVSLAVATKARLTRVQAEQDIEHIYNTWDEKLERRARNDQAADDLDYARSAHEIHKLQSADGDLGHEEKVKAYRHKAELEAARKAYEEPDEPEADLSPGEAVAMLDQEIASLLEQRKALSEEKDEDWQEYEEITKVINQYKEMRRQANEELLRERFKSRQKK